MPDARTCVCGHPRDGHCVTRGTSTPESFGRCGYATCACGAFHPESFNFGAQMEAAGAMGPLGDQCITIEVAPDKNEEIEEALRTAMSGFDIPVVSAAGPEALRTLKAKADTPLLRRILRQWPDWHGWRDGDGEPYRLGVTSVAAIVEDHETTRLLEGDPQTRRWSECYALCVGPESPLPPMAKDVVRGFFMPCTTDWIPQPPEED